MPVIATKKQPEQYSKVRSSSNTSSYYLNKPSSTRNTTVQTQMPQKLENDASLIAGTCSFHLTKPSENRRQSIKSAGIISYERTNSLTSYNRKFLQSEHEHSSTNESISRSQIPNCRSLISNGTDNDEDELCRNTMKLNVAPSRHSSVSSLSEEGSLGSIEEWALLELCISSGMPKTKYGFKGMKGTEGNNHEEHDTIAEDNYSICSYNSYVCKT